LRIAIGLAVVTTAAFLWKRAAGAVKTLVRKHPRAALSAAGAGTVYTVKSVVHNIAEAISRPFSIGNATKLEQIIQLESDEKTLEFTSEEKAEFVKSLTRSDRDALLDLAESGRDDADTSWR
jgi:stage V sporulation protein SpoVS